MSLKHCSSFSLQLLLKERRKFPLPFVFKKTNKPPYQTSLSLSSLSLSKKKKMKTLFFSLTLFFYLSQTFKEAKGQCNTLSYHPPEKPNQQTPEHFVIPKPKSETEKLFSKPNLPFSDDDDDDDNDNDPSLKADKGILNSYIFQFLSVRARSPVLDAAISRYKEKIFLPCWSTSILQNRNLSSSSSSSSSSKRDFSKGNEFPILGLRIAVSERQEMRLGEEMLEYYHLEIDPFSDGWAFLSAPSVWGALRGLEKDFLEKDFLEKDFFGKRFFGKRFFGKRFFGKRFFGKRFFGKRFFGKRLFLFLKVCFLFWCDFYSSIFFL